MTADSYRALVDLDRAVSIEPDPRWADSLGSVLAALGVDVPDGVSVDKQLQALHGVLALADPRTIDPALVSRIESVAAGWTSQKALVDPLALPTLADEGSTHPAAAIVSLVIADITTITADAIVNAANGQLLGCRIPNHACIDNAIHSAAGPRLRNDCAVIIDQVGGPEPVGLAKITRAYALPSRFVLHTVGPQLARGAEPTEAEEQALYDCYTACLETAAAVDAVRTVAFCGISTGVFAYPKRAAAAVALRAIGDWVSTHPGRFDRLVIDCFSRSDAEVYADVHAEQYGVS